MVMDATENFEAMDEEIFTKFAGKCIAVIEGEVVVSGDSFKEVYKEVNEKYPSQRALFATLRPRKLIVGSY